MRFDFENIGSVKNGSIELGDLTILCGENNVGKTYLTYAIYGLLRSKSSASEIVFPDNINDFFDKKKLVIRFDELVRKNKELLVEISNGFSSELADFFNADKKLFDDSKVIVRDVEFDGLDVEGRAIFEFGNSSLQLKKEKGSNEALLVYVKSEDDDDDESGGDINSFHKDFIKKLISQGVVDILLRDVFFEPFVITSERTGVSLFYKELDVNKNAIMEMLSMKKDIKPWEIFDLMKSRYCVPIKHNIDVIRDADNISKKQSFLRKNKKRYNDLFSLFEQLVGGTFSSDEQQVMYTPTVLKGKKKVTLPIYMASSSIKSLYLFDLYINNLAKENGLLIIDEPELNLHPSNQRKMAGVIARLVNAGVKVILTTHSDFFVKEINNRILLSKIPSRKLNKLLSNISFVKSDILDPNRIKAYTIKEGQIESLLVDEDGISFTPFDEEINDANALADIIYYGV
ncbi:hypothetical protein EFS38_02980 [Dickeya undicola]|uniref:Endonuclease GajA/Old nuclease/RecF-like AAA domain-containing protein n=1 Tax=Dickeya undicola TaxID=1577887 RepID=A0ABX9WXC6_9GAMM|nr:AAA family ATPase [Dickeya undicola]RNM26728.1 hypothetical protein EFS38_02980 [Dickeya undicola]